MISKLILLTAIWYLITAFAWYCVFTYQFNFRMTVNVGGETLQKDFKGIELAIICLLWIFFFPPAIINMFKKNKEDN